MVLGCSLSRSSRSKRPVFWSSHGTIEDSERLVRDSSVMWFITERTHILHRDSFPKEHAVALKDMLMELTGKSIASGRSKVILRKLYVAVSVYTIMMP